MSIADEIKKLHELKEQGILSDSEFEEQKKKILEVPATESTKQTEETTPDETVESISLSELIDGLHARGAISKSQYSTLKTEVEAGRGIKSLRREKIEDLVMESGKKGIVDLWKGVFPDGVDSESYDRMTNRSRSEENSGSSSSVMFPVIIVVVLVLSAFGLMLYDKVPSIQSSSTQTVKPGLSDDQEAAKVFDCMESCKWKSGGSAISSSRSNNYLWSECVKQNCTGRFSDKAFQRGGEQFDRINF